MSKKFTIGELEQKEKKEVIVSVKAPAGDVAFHDALIAKKQAEGFRYIDSTMIYAGEMVIRFGRQV
jgi:hypothetical protein